MRCCGVGFLSMNNISEWRILLIEGNLIFTQKIPVQFGYALPLGRQMEKSAALEAVICGFDSHLSDMESWPSLAEGNGLENRTIVNSVAGVRIPHFPHTGMIFTCITLGVSE